MEKSERTYSLIFVRDRDKKQVLLGLKKRGFGIGKYNGFGGKQEENESIDECCCRELQEESGLIVTTKDIKKLGYLVFHMQESNKIMNVHVYSTDTYSGELVETDEMKPCWFDENPDTLPYDKMWIDDKYWMNIMMQDKRFIGRFVYEDDETIEDYSINILE